MKGQNARVRVSLPSKDELNRRSIYFAKQNTFPWKKAEESMYFFIKCQLYDIKKQEIEILKSKKRIERNRIGIQIAEEIIEELNR